jgi:hypothetical protein
MSGEPTGARDEAVEQWRRVVAEHVMDEQDEQRRCRVCRAYWPCWERAYAYEQLILNGATE